MKIKRIVSMLLVVFILHTAVAFAEATVSYPSDSVIMTNVRIANEGCVGTVRNIKKWNGFLFAAVAYDSDTTANANKIVVYDLEGSAVDYSATKTALIDGKTARIYPDAALTAYAQWNMTDLGITVTGDSSQEQIIGIDVTDEKICVLTRWVDSSTSYKYAGLHVFKNNIERGTESKALVKLYSESVTVLYNNGHPSLLDIMPSAMMEGPVTKTIGDTLVAIYPHTTIHNGKGAKITAVKFTDNENLSVVTKNSFTILKKPDGTSLTSNGATLSGTVFSEDKAYIMVVDTNDSNKKYLEVVDFSTPSNPILISSTLISNDEDTNTTMANISVWGKYAYITTSGDKCASNSYLYIVDTETMKVVKSITASEIGFTFTNSAGFGKSYVNDNVFIAFEGYTRAKAYCLIEFDESFNIKTYSIKNNTIHTEMIAQANGVVACGGNLYVSCDKPALQTREGLTDIYNIAAIAAFDISNCVIPDEITESYDAQNIKRTLQANETVSIAQSGLLSNAVIDATSGSVKIGSDVTATGCMRFNTDGELDTAVIGKTVALKTIGYKENSCHWGFIKTVELSEISSPYTVTLTSSDNKTLDTDFNLGDGIFTGTARLLIGIRNVPEEIEISCE